MLKNLKFQLYILILLVVVVISCDNDKKIEQKQTENSNEIIAESNPRKNKKIKLKIDTIETINKIDSTKYKILQANIGTFYLESIEGAAGANATYETYKDEKGTWYASGSSISGIRTGDDPALSKKDQMILKSIKLDIDSTLNLSLNVWKSKIINTKYKDEKLDIQLQNKLEDISNPIDNGIKITDSNYVFGKHLAILIGDSFDFSKILPVDSGISSNENTFMLVYNISKNEFILYVFDPDDRARFKFKFSKKSK